MIGYSVIATMWGALLSAILSSSNKSLLNKLFSLGFLCNLGKYSYGLYVFHPFIQAYTSGPIFYLAQIIPTDFLKYLFCAIVFFISSYMISLISFHLYEKKLLRLKALFV